MTEQREADSRASDETATRTQRHRRDQEVHAARVALTRVLMWRMPEAERQVLEAASHSLEQLMMAAGQPGLSADDGSTVAAEREIEPPAGELRDQ